MGIGMSAMIVRLGLIYGELSSLDNVSTMFGRQLELAEWLVGDRDDDAPAPVVVGHPPVTVMPPVQAAIPTPSVVVPEASRIQ